RLPGAGPAPAGTASGGNGAAPPGLRMMAARLLSGMARLDGQFATLWRPCSREVFLVTVTAPGGGGIAARWRVDLASAAITSASGLAPGETGGAQWDIIGSADTWKQVLDGRRNPPPLRRQPSRRVRSRPASRPHRRRGPRPRRTRALGPQWRRGPRRR